MFKLSMEIHISDDVSLDAQLVMTGRGCIIGQSGSGKSFLMSLIAEQLLNLGLPFCVIDTEGEYISLKNGSRNVLVVGGENGDLPADIDFEKLFKSSLESSIPVIFDVSDVLDKANAVYNALSSLYAIEEKERKPYPVLIEEADIFAPQIVRQKINIIEELSVRGRKRGIGLIVATQRPSNISKNVLSQCSYGFIGKLTIENDLSAISQLFSGRSALDEIVNLSTGEFMPFGIDYKQRFKVSGRISRHMGATPKITEKAPATVPDISGIISMLKSNTKNVPLLQAETSRKKPALRTPTEKGHVFEVLPFTFDEQQAKNYAFHASRKMFGIFGKSVEEPESIVQKYLRASLCTIRIPTGKKQEFEERSVIIGSDLQIIQLRNGLYLKRLHISPVKLSASEESVLRRIRSRRNTTKDYLIKRGLVKADSSWRTIRKLETNRLITFSNGTMNSDSYSEFYLDQVPDVTQSVVLEEQIEGSQIMQEEAAKLMKNLYPTCSLVGYSQILIPIYEITLRRKNKVRVFKIDGIKGKEIRYG